MAFCQNCGQQFPDGTPQCPNCGIPLMQQPVYQQNPYPNQQQFTPNMNVQQTKKKKKGEGCLIAIIIVFALFFVLPALYRNSNQSNTTEQATHTLTVTKRKMSIVRIK